MQSSELRIGNYVNSKNDGIIKITNISENSVAVSENHCYNHIPIHLIKPVKINKEWLLNHGFKKHETYSLIDIKTGSLELMNIFEMYFRPYFKGKSINVDIEHVHQIQNLYFALTGEELTLKTN